MRRVVLLVLLGFLVVWAGVGCTFSLDLHPGQPKTEEATK